MYTIRKTLSRRRIMQLRKKPLREDEFIAVLSRCERGNSESEDAFQGFTDHITDLAKRRKMAKSNGDGEKGGGDSGKKKKKKKK